VAPQHILRVGTQPLSTGPGNRTNKPTTCQTLIDPRLSHCAMTTSDTAPPTLVASPLWLFAQSVDMLCQHKAQGAEPAHLGASIRGRPLLHDSTTTKHGRGRKGQAAAQARQNDDLGQHNHAVCATAAPADAVS
jgi:hypothetical protein